MSILFRPATLEDAEMLLDWRNDPVTRANSINEDEVPWEDHINWLESSLKREDRKLLIAMNGKPVGTVRLDIRPEETELSWTVAPEARRSGVGYQMVSEASRDKTGLIAKIKRENMASQKIAARAGFYLVKDDDLQEWRK